MATLIPHLVKVIGIVAIIQHIPTTDISDSVLVLAGASVFVLADIATRGETNES